MHHHEQTPRLYTTERNAINVSKRIKNYIRCKREGKNWDAGDDVLFIPDAPRSSQKSFDSLSCKDIVLYWDKFLGWSIKKNYKGTITAHVKRMTLGQQWNGIRVWIKWAQRNPGNEILVFQGLEFEELKRALDIGEILDADPTYIQKLKALINAW